MRALGRWTVILGGAVLGTATVLADLAWFVLRALFGPPSADSYETGGAFIPRPELGEGWDFDDDRDASPVPTPDSELF